ncbi:MAG: hypothetical protein IKZ28_05930 [Clostridia bacterium]|nr:hypothetical protein [Clostridia bacterium]
MSKKTATILSAIFSTALVFTGTAFFGGQKHTSTANASEAELGGETPAVTSLLAPSSYEQYLALTAPADVAVTNSLKAISDGNRIYIYDSADNLYRSYTHTEAVHTLQFLGEDELYFSDDMARLYRLTPSSLKETAEVTQINNLSCSNFALQGGYVYYTTVVASKTSVYAYKLSDGTTKKLLSLEAETPLVYGKDGLYYLRKKDGLFTLYALNPQSSDEPLEITSFDKNVREMIFAKNLFCFITDEGDFYSYDYSVLKETPLATNAEFITCEKGNFSALGANETAVYAVYKNGIREYFVENAEFTDFEICSSSSSQNRFHGSTETLLSGNKLFIADGENERISVYDTAEKEFETAINTTLPTPYLASCGNTLLVASSSEAILYDLNDKHYGEEKLSLLDGEMEGDVIGAVSVYDRYYLLTSSNYCYCLTLENGVWKAQETQKKLHRSAIAFAADAYGSLYVAYNDEDVYRFTEKDFLSPSENGVKILEDVKGVEKLAIDYESSLYTLSNGAITKYQQTDGVYTQVSVYAPTSTPVFDETPKLRSFAFGVETEYAYLLYEGDYLVETNELRIPTVNPIPVGNASALLFGNGNPNFSAVQLQKDCILIEFSADELQTATKFPYLAFKRVQAEQTALKLGEEGDYSILATVDERTGSYKTYLALTSECKAIPENEYKTTYLENKTGYITNTVSLYKFPYLNELFALCEITRGEEVKIVGEMKNFDRDYYEIEITTEEGITTGYIPQSFITLFNGEAPDVKNEIFGATETDDDAVWRCAYLLLGFGAIGILLDFLILHKRKDD